MERNLIILCLFSLLWAAPATGQTPSPPMTKGTIFKDCPLCPEMIVVPKGAYIMGFGGTNRHGPPRRVAINKPFAIGRFEVKFNEWSACVAQMGCRHQPDDHKWGTVNRPVINVTWAQAKNYIRWLSQKTGHTYRLPSEAEWEYVARAGTTTRFWWGDKPGEKRANCRDCESRQCCSVKNHACCSHETKPVGSYLANPFGLFDTAGNVFEWTEDCWNPNHKDRPKDARARTEGDCRSRVIRGGSFYYFNKVISSHYRAKNPSTIKSYWLGFRVVRELG